jgi:inorganic triphosphatase YgiF
VALERELKLAIAPRAVREAARALRLPSRRRVLQSIYFDTPRSELRRRRMALRLRRDGERWVQTLKAERRPGERYEWETPVASSALELSRLPRAAIRRATGVALSSIADRLRPLFETRFTRRVRMLSAGEARIELALDRGYVRAGRRRAAICEIELELKAGTMRTLRRVAAALAKRFSLVPLSESKAARGYRLARGE